MQSTDKDTADTKCTSACIMQLSIKKKNKNKQKKKQNMNLCIKDIFAFQCVSYFDMKDKTKTNKQTTKIKFPLS